MPPVTITVRNDLPVPVAVFGVVISFYDLSAVFQTSGLTDEDGEVTVELPDGSYNVLLYKQGLSILPRQPQRIIIDSLTDDSFNFLISGHERTIPESESPRRCKISGYLTGIGGQRTKAKLIFEPVSELIIIDDRLVDFLGRLEVESDDEGYIEFELLRGQAYLVYFLYIDSFLGMAPPACLEVTVPDRPGIELTRFLFPIPLFAEFSVLTKTLGAAADPDASVDILVHWSDGNSRWNSRAWAGFKLVNDHPEIVDFSVSAGKVVLKPISVGVATLSIDRVMPVGPTFNPLDDFVSDTLTVTVSP